MHGNTWVYQVWCILFEQDALWCARVSGGMIASPSLITGSRGAGKGSTVFNLQDNVLMNVMMMLWYSDAGRTNYLNPIDDAEDYDGVMHQAYPWTLSKIYKAVHFFQIKVKQYWYSWHKRKASKFCNITLKVSFSICLMYSIQFYPDELRVSVSGGANQTSGEFLRLKCWSGRKTKVFSS